MDPVVQGSTAEKTADPPRSKGLSTAWTMLIGPPLLDARSLARSDSLGSYFSGLLESFGDVVALVLDSVVVTARAVRRGRFAWRECGDQAWMLVSVALLPTVFIAVPFGGVIVLEVGGLANQVGATSFTGAVDALTTVREVAPIVTALILSGAGGSAICADLGSRTIRDEIAAMEVMGVSPLERLVAPRILAGVVVAVLLNGIVAFAGLVAAYAADVYILGGTSGGYLEAFSSFAQGADIIESTLKAFIFGFIATVLACYKGLHARKGAVGVGLAVNQSVVVTGLALFTLDLVLTDIFLVIVPLKVP